MKQLYYTSCRPGRSLGGAGGLQVRAASADLSGARARAAATFAGYALPSDATPEVGPDRRAPVRLAYLATEDVGRLICQSVFAGKDVTGVRGGNFFSHVLLDLPDNWGARQAVALWGHSGWRQEDGDFDANLVDGAAFTTSPNDSQTVRDFLATPRCREMFCFVLSALMRPRIEGPGGGPAAQPERVFTGRVFLAAPPAEVAACVEALTRALPRGFYGSLTFSTFESAPRSCDAVLVATCWIDPARADLPEACYTGGSAGFNFYTGRHSTLAEHSYAKFATEMLCHGRDELVSQVCDAADEAEVCDPAALDLVFRLEMGGDLIRADIDTALRYPKLAALLASQGEIPARVFDWAVEDTAFARTALPGLVAAARRSGEAAAEQFVTGCVSRARELGIAALRAGNLPCATLALETVLPFVDAGQLPLIWRGLLAQFPNPAALPTIARLYVLSRSARRDSAPANGAIRVPNEAESWLNVPPAELASLLAADLPDAYKLVAFVHCVTKTEGTLHPAAIAWLAARPDLLCDVMAGVAASVDQARPDLAAALFASVQEAAGRQSLLEELPRRARGRDVSLSAAVIGACACHALRCGRVTASGLVAAWGQQATQFLEPPTLAYLTTALLAEPDLQATERPQVLAYLHAVAASASTSEGMRESIQARLAVEAFLESPSHESAAILPVASALAGLAPAPRAACGQRIPAAIAAAVVRLSCSPTPVAVPWVGIQCFLTHLAPLLGAPPAEHFRRLITHARELVGDRSFWGDERLGPWLLAAGLCAVTAFPRDQAAGHQLHDEVIDLAEQIARRGGARAWTAVEQLSTAWPAGPRRDWQVLCRFIHPAAGLRHFVDSMTRWRQPR